MNQEINFYTCCNKVYNNFIPTFILSNLYHNENSSVELSDQSYSMIKEFMSFNDIGNSIIGPKNVLSLIQENNVF